MNDHITVGQRLIQLLEEHDVDTVFGIPGVHTVELYRGLAASRIRHVTPRQEQDAGFMADGYARVSGKPGVCLVITGPGVTNTITAMGQARGDSIPMLVISGVNALGTLGRCEGHLHELPDQRAMLATVALTSERLERPEDICGVVARAFATLRSGRPGPVHIEIPTDLMKMRVAEEPEARPHQSVKSHISVSAISQAANLCREAVRPVILAGGGAVWADAPIRALADRLNAPVVTTTNARGILAGHPLLVPASPSLPALRKLMSDADLIIAIGTQFGPTDYDAFEDGGLPRLERILRIDIDPDAAETSIPATTSIVGDAVSVTEALVDAIGSRAPISTWGISRAAHARHSAFAELSPKSQALIEVLQAIRNTVPDCVMVGDSTQLAYAGNLYLEAAAPRTWFNAATGYGSLGYGPPAAVGASVALGQTPVICLVGDGGFQFCLGALGAAADEATPVIFLVWNNHGYQEIEDYMCKCGVEPVGVRPGAPNFVKLAEAYGISAERVHITFEMSHDALRPGALNLVSLIGALRRARDADRPALIEVEAP